MPKPKISNVTRILSETRSRMMTERDLDEGAFSGRPSPQIFTKNLPGRIEIHDFGDLTSADKRKRAREARGSRSSIQ